jgi:methylenetetrahydrofolate dehydrogenase (NADP+)/methenyltetrahydrofolate cyclohydrolase
MIRVITFERKRTYHTKKKQNKTKNTMQIIDGKAVADEIKKEIGAEVRAMKAAGEKTPHLVAILVGNNGASETYVANKVKSCEELGFNSTLLRFPPSITEAELLAEVQKVNDNEDMDGLIVQLPLPDHINPDRVMETIDPRKDVDGFHPINIGRMAKGLPAYISATPQGVLDLLERYNIETSGKHCVVVGRSQIVGLPMSILMQRNHKVGNCTVTLTHSKTKNLAEVCASADILIAALGRPEFITAEYVKEGAVVIDVGLTRVEDTTKKSGFALKGDVKFDEVAPKCSFITPVPKGVGPMTIVSLMKNTLLSAKGVIYQK